MHSLFRASVAALALCLTACPLNVGPSSPRPNVMVKANEAPSSLAMEAHILDAYTIPGTGSVNSIDVTGWRATLTNGFASAFPGGTSGKRLEIIEAELSFAPAAVGPGGTAAVRASIRYKVRLVDASGKELGAIAGHAEAREAATSIMTITDNSSKAVEALFETVAAQLINPSTK